ncbi:MAG: vanadium-dependent haloperoxidase [Planctomycetota bacterium]
MKRLRLFLATAVAAALAGACASTDLDGMHVRHMQAPKGHDKSFAFVWMDVMLEAAARDVERIGARPTILSRQMAIPTIAMYEAWAAFDDVAVGPYFGASLRRPPAERTDANRRAAIAYAMFDACIDQYPHHRDYLREQMQGLGYDPDAELDDDSAGALGRRIAARIVTERHHDGANQLGDRDGSRGGPYSDYTDYRPVNPVDEIRDPDRWQPIPFDDGNGGKVVVPFLTPHWLHVQPFGLERGDQLRPGPPPLVGSEQLRREVDEVLAMNASLDPDQKALVEFMRDGPRSTGQSGHWLRFAQDVSVRDGNDLDADVKLFLAVAVTAMDTFIASWDAKRHYDSSRPWTLVRHYYPDATIRGWAGPGKGVVEMKGSQWHPYSPSTFITPPFPGYPSGHSTVSGGCAEILRLLTGSDRFGVLEERVAGELTEAGVSCDQMQQVDGVFPIPGPDGQPLTCDVRIPIATFRQAAELAGISRVLGGYHIQADNVVGLELGREVAQVLWPKLQALFDGTAGAAQATGGAGSAVPGR